MPTHEVSKSNRISGINRDICHHRWPSDILRRVVESHAACIVVIALIQGALSGGIQRWIRHFEFTTLKTCGVQKQRTM